MKSCTRLTLFAVGLLFGGFVSPCLAAPAFKHIVIIVQENRTPDNLFGSNPTFEPGVDIATSGVNSLGQVIPLTAVPYLTCYDLGHTHKSYEETVTLGADRDLVDPVGSCNRATIPPNTEFKYIDNSAGIVQPYFDMATQYGFANRMFQTNEGPSMPAHLFLFAGTSQPSTESPVFIAENTPGSKGQVGCVAPPTYTVPVIDANGSETSNPQILPCAEHPTMSDVLEKAGLTWHYYGPSPAGIWMAPAGIQHICGATTTPKGRMVCGGADFAANVVTSSTQIVTDVAACKLSSVTWVIPTGDESDHATLSNGTGPSWVASIVNAIGEQAACGTNNEVFWRDTAILVTWDDWGGWYDHVPPISMRPAGENPPRWGDAYVYGLRVPLLVMSAYTPAGYVDNQPHDFGGLLNFVEQNFGLGFIGPGDTIYSNYADYQAVTELYNNMSGFFSLSKPRAFQPIAAPVSAATLLRAKVTNVGPDED